MCLTRIRCYAKTVTIHLSSVGLQFGKDRENIRVTDLNNCGDWTECVPLAWPWVNKWWSQSQYREELSRGFSHLLQNWPARNKPSTITFMFEWSIQKLTTGMFPSYTYVISGTLVLFTDRFQWIWWSTWGSEIRFKKSGILQLLLEEKEKKKTKTTMWHFTEIIFSFYHRAVTFGFWLIKTIIKKDS